MTVINTVNASERKRASHIPGVPSSCGKNMKHGIRNMKPRSKANIVAGFTLSIL